jgi:protein-tyrosine phosphatase
MKISDYEISKLYFTCDGNTCRSPMAEAIAKNYAIKKHHDIYIASRRTCIDDMTVYSAFIGLSDGASYAIMKYLGDKKFCENHKPQTMTREELRESSLVLTMTNVQRENLRKYSEAYQKETCKVYTLNEFAGLDEPDIIDPFGEDADAYENKFLEIGRAVEIIFSDGFKGNFRKRK